MSNLPLTLAIPADVADEVCRHIDNLRDDWEDHPIGVGEIAFRLGLLPLSLDTGGFAALKPDGNVVTVLWDEPTTERPVASARQRDIALSVGAQRYPVVKRLLPKRQAVSETCRVCGGTGKHPLAAKVGVDNIVCSCGGLGWLPEYWGPA
jgi:hypothetical protein